MCRLLCLCHSFHTCIGVYYTGLTYMYWCVLHWACIHVTVCITLGLHTCIGVYYTGLAYMYRCVLHWAYIHVSVCITLGLHTCRLKLTPMPVTSLGTLHSTWLLVLACLLLCLSSWLEVSAKHMCCIAV